MKNFLLAVVLSLVSLTSFGQLIINQSIIETPPYKVGDTLTVKYTVVKGTTTPRYFWLRYQFSNKHLQYVPNSTVFSQGSSSQTYFTNWDNYKFNQNPNIGVGALDQQYASTPWGYTPNVDWNVGQLTVQRTDATIDGQLATQKYIIKDAVNYQYVHKLDMANAFDASGTSIPNIGSQVLQMSVTEPIKGGTSAFKVRVVFPTSHTNIVDQNVQIMPLTTAGLIDWASNPTPLAVQPLNAQGEATFSQFKIGDKFGVVITPAYQKTWMNNIVTVTDAYKAFSAIANVGLSGTNEFFQYPAIEKIVGNISKTGNTFDETDAYYIFAHIMGIDVSANAMIPSSTATSVRFVSGKKAGFNAGTLNNYAVEITAATQTEDFAYAWGGDLDFSHSSSPSAVETQSTRNVGVQSIGTMNRTITPAYYANKVLEQATLSVSSKIENGKVVLTTSLTKADLAGLQVIMKYDVSKLTLDNVIFDSGTTVTNFSTNKDGRLTFGSIDQLKTARIKTGTPYKLVFTPNVPLTNTAGLFYTELSDAVDGKGNKIDLIVE
jgi:hypothetical protein